MMHNLFPTVGQEKGNLFHPTFLNNTHVFEVHFKMTYLIRKCTSRLLKICNFSRQVHPKSCKGGGENFVSCSKVCVAVHTQ